MARTLQRLGVEPLVSDGGMGSLLQTAVVRARCPEEANLIAPEQVVALNGRMIRDPRLERYLAAHKQFAGTSALGVPSTFLRSATVDAEPR